MVHAALGARWDCVLANDIDAMKCETYRQNWGGAHLLEGDVAGLSADTLYRDLDLVWASSPCQDFSLAGKGKGLKGLRSGVFYHWMRLLSQASFTCEPPTYYVTNRFVYIPFCVHARAAAYDWKKTCSNCAPLSPFWV